MTLFQYILVTSTTLFHWRILVVRLFQYFLVTSMKSLH